LSELDVYLLIILAFIYQLQFRQCCVSVYMNFVKKDEDKEKIYPFRYCCCCRCSFCGSDASVVPLVDVDIALSSELELFSPVKPKFHYVNIPWTCITGMSWGSSDLSLGSCRFGGSYCRDVTG